MKGRPTWGGLLLRYRVCYSECKNIFVNQYFSLMRVCCEPQSPITLPFCSTSPLLSSCCSLYPPLSPSRSSSITAALPCDIDLGRVATAALKLNMPAALRRAQMRCGAMDHRDLLHTGLIHESTTALTLSGHVRYSSPLLQMLDTQPVMTWYRWGEYILDDGWGRVARKSCLRIHCERQVRGYSWCSTASCERVRDVESSANPWMYVPNSWFMTFNCSDIYNREYVFKGRLRSLLLPLVSHLLIYTSHIYEVT